MIQIFFRVDSFLRIRTKTYAWIVLSFFHLGLAVKKIFHDSHDDDSNIDT